MFVNCRFQGTMLIGAIVPGNRTNCGCDPINQGFLYFLVKKVNVDDTTQQGKLCDCCLQKLMADITFEALSRRNVGLDDPSLEDNLQNNKVAKLLV